MALFGRKSTRGRQTDPDPRRRVELLLPPGSMFNAADFNAWLAAWSGSSVGAVPLLPAGLRWGGPRAADANRGEPPGSWVWHLQWSADPVGSVGQPSADLGQAASVLELVGWLYDRARGGEDPPVGGPRVYAEAAMRGLARRTGGSVRLPGGRPQPPGDPEATWSVYLTAPVRAGDAVAALAGSVPGLEMATASGASSWVLEEPAGRGFWLEEIDVDGADSWESFPGPHALPTCVLPLLRRAQLWAVRCEGAHDRADAADRQWLGVVSRALAEALGGVAVDPEGFPVAGGG